MFVVRRESETLQKDGLKFKSVRKIKALNNVFYFQGLSYEEKDLYIEVPFFKSNGMSYSSYSNMRQMRITLPKWEQDLLKLLDESAREQVECPQDGPSHWKKSFDDGTAFRNIADPQTIFLKLSDSFQAFDLFKNPIDCDELKRGKYMALIHVTGIYIGGHGATGKLASLQMKVTQLLYQPIPHDECFIEFDLSASDCNRMETDEKAKEDSGNKKKERRSYRKQGETSPIKPKLKRVNAHADLTRIFPSTQLDEATQF